MEVTFLEPIEIAKRIIEIVSDRQAVDILMLDIRKVVDFADYFIICSGESRRQIDTLSDEIDIALKQEGLNLFHREGTAESGWILLDFAAVIVHIFSPEEREYYGLEQLWSRGIHVFRIQ